MALQYVALTFTMQDAGQDAQAGSVVIFPTSVVTAAGVTVVDETQVVRSLASGTVTVSLVACDNTGTTPAAGFWAYNIQLPGGAGGLYLVNYSNGASQRFDNLSPAVASTTYGPAASGSGFTDPMTTLGDIIYEDATPTAVRLAGNTTLTRKFLRQTGTGTVSAAPAWDTLTVADLPTIQAPALGDTLSPSAQPTVYKFTIPFNNATLAGTNAATAQVTLAVLPAGAVLLNTKIYHTLQFTGTGLSTLLAQLSAGGTQYGSARTSLASAPADPPTFAGSNLPDGRQAGTLTVVLGFSETGGGTLNNLSAGSVDVYLLVVQMG